MATKLYLHRSGSAVSGTLPATNATVALADTPTWTPGQTNSVANTPLLTNLTMDETISGSAQTSLAYSTDNVTTNQKQPLLRWISEPLAAQTIVQQTVTYAYATSHSNSNSVFLQRFVLRTWRPSTGANIGSLFEFGSGDSGGAGTSQTAQSVNLSTNFTSVTVLAGDVLVFEIWRGTTAQSMATSYTNTVFYDGTTEGSASNIAAYISFPNTLTFTGAATTLTPDAVAVPLVTAAPSVDRTLVLTPSAVAIPLVAPDPTVAIVPPPTVLTPSPVTIPLSLTTPIVGRHPIIVEVLGSWSSSVNSALTINLPTTVSVGDQRIVFLRTGLSSILLDSNFTFTEIYRDSPDGADDTVAIFWKEYAAGDSNTLTISAFTATKFAAIAIAVRGGQDFRLLPAYALATGTDAAPDPASLDTGTSRDYLWLAVASAEGTQTNPFTYPTGYHIAQATLDSGTTGVADANVRIASAAQAETAQTEDPPAFGMSAANDWTAFTIAWGPLEAATRTLTPSVVTIPILRPNPTIALTYTLTPSAVAIPLSIPDPLVALGFSVSPVFVQSAVAQFLDVTEAEVIFPAPVMADSLLIADVAIRFGPEQDGDINVEWAPGPSPPLEIANLGATEFEYLMLGHWFTARATAGLHTFRIFITGGASGHGMPVNFTITISEYAGAEYSPLGPFMGSNGIGTAATSTATTVPTHPVYMVHSSTSQASGGNVAITPAGDVEVTSYNPDSARGSPIMTTTKVVTTPVAETATFTYASSVEWTALVTVYYLIPNYEPLPPADLPVARGGG